jgi:hypothetical protein
MNARVRKTGRFARVRMIQHSLAAIAAAKATQQVESLEASMVKLVSLRDGARPPAGVIPGAMLAGAGEIAMRLDAAREQVARSADAARARAARCQEARLLARRNEDIAERLKEATVKAVEGEAERKQQLRSCFRKRSLVEE